jgi:hypothetical protein
MLKNLLFLTAKNMDVAKYMLLNPEQINQILESAKQLTTLQEESNQDHSFTIQYLISQAQGHVNNHFSI